MKRALYLAFAAAGLVAAPFMAQAASFNDGKIVIAQSGGGGGGAPSGGSGAGSGSGSNPPGSISPGTQRDSVPSADVRTPGYERTNPNVDDPDSKRGRGKNSSGSTLRSTPDRNSGSSSGSTSGSTAR